MESQTNTIGLASKNSMLQTCITLAPFYLTCIAVTIASISLFTDHRNDQRQDEELKNPALIIEKLRKAKIKDNHQIEELKTAINQMIAYLQSNESDFSEEQKMTISQRRQIEGVIMQLQNAYETKILEITEENNQKTGKVKRKFEQEMKKAQENFQQMINRNNSELINTRELLEKANTTNEILRDDNIEGIRKNAVLQAIIGQMKINTSETLPRTDEIK
jgi:uncharacterized protein with PIN domain